MGSDIRFLDPGLTRIELRYPGFQLYRTEDGHELHKRPSRWTYGVPVVVKVCRLSPLSRAIFDPDHVMPIGLIYTEHIFYPVRPTPEVHVEHCYWKDEENA